MPTASASSVAVHGPSWRRAGIRSREGVVRAWSAAAGLVAYGVGAARRLQVAQAAVDRGQADADSVRDGQGMRFRRRASSGSGRACGAFRVR
ncbi:hypothetical protein ADK58_17390 [Streptomyces sp. XY152]|nr:hypothetical protein ADK58_17390 [Streptomyces sp. XY152]